MSKTKDLIAVSTKIAGSGLAVMVLSHLTNDPKLASSLGTLGIGAYAATESAKLFIGLAPNFIVNWCQQAKDVKNHDKNHDIENALRQAYTKTILHIEDDFISENELEESYLHLIKRKVGLSNAEQNKKKVLHEYFFEKLIQHFTDENELAHFIGNNEQLDLGAYLEKVFFESLIDANWDVTLGNEFKIDELVLYFKERFVKYFPQNFVQEIKHNEKAKTAYFKILLELSIARISEVKQDTENLLWSTEQIQSTLELLNLIAIRTDNNLAQLLESQLKDSAVLHSLFPSYPK